MVENGLTTRPRVAPGRRIYAIGDVHGHLDRLEAMHARIGADLARRPINRPMIIHLGDLIDRGPDSAGCVDLLAGGPPLTGVPTINLMGNHEWMMLAALEAQHRDDIDRWLDNGGDKSLWSWGLRSTTPSREWLAAIPARHLVFLRDLKRSWTEQGYLFVHAGIRPGIPMGRQREQDLLWIRDSFLNWKGVMLPEAPERVVVHGHTPQEAPVLRHNRIGLDTGAGKGGPLTCGVLENDGVGIFQT